MAYPTDLAQRPIKTGSFSPHYRLTLGGKVITDRLYDCSVTYSADGTSDLTINADTDLERYEGAEAVLEIGYGDNLWPYFGGWVEEPEIDHWGGPSTCDCYGPFKELGELYFDDDVTYAGKTLGDVIVDVHLRAGRIKSTYQIKGSPGYLLTGEEAGVAIGTTFSDGLGNMLEMANWRSSDRPSFERLYTPLPRPHPSANVSATYTEAHYPPNGFRARVGKPYGAVGAFARLEDGSFAWPPVLVRVRPEVPASRIYWLEDYQGSEQDAFKECGQLASMLEAGIFTWTLEGISANPELLLYDTIRVHTTELRDEGGRFKERYEAVYACMIDSSVSVDVSREGMPMNLAGDTAVLISSYKIARPFVQTRPNATVMR